VRVIEPDGSELARFAAADYLDHIAERVLPWSYLKFPYLKAKGWSGLTDGPDSGVYRVNSLARLNVATGMATPRAQAEYERLYETLGEDPVHGTLAYHWARLVELLFCAEAVHTAVRDPEITSPEVRVLPSAKPTVGVGAVEAARGTLYHHYETDAQGIVTAVNLIVATVQNNAAMGMSVKRAAEHLIKDGAADDAILAQVEMAFRAYDPCLACATHALPGEMPLEVRLMRGGKVERTLRRD
jgi:F420-non-reducing hydrogenase large subunit